MVSENEAQELHEIIGACIEEVEDSPNTEMVNDLKRAREIAALIISDLEPLSTTPIIVSGNPRDGMSFTGPFAGAEEALNYAEDLSDTWWLVNVERPETP